ncbi:uncharacterized protein PADG_11429 [Paracoccidioides brasiliensis Pb18]|uniref:Uncharacterized protein n=2 Tax=Paracoccidioides brasiliensis TaxID=121759 RepID=A0A0A0HY27_PARBD|nr:uncharacterized protein PADG_11429 [Paracoccidioides brasiliensis Pb18]KGM92245.1 hypothetical protein PADG_11429 [Paracoccidioides brasiliensis Pb18]ODH39817.1 hypothetical protein ACO22_01760 [Paracoccidioides brasiliensis]
MDVALKLRSRKYTPLIPTTYASLDDAKSRGFEAERPDLASYGFPVSPPCLLSSRGLHQVVHSLTWRCKKGLRVRETRILDGNKMGQVRSLSGVLTRSRRSVGLPARNRSSTNPATGKTGWKVRAIKQSVTRKKNRGVLALRIE